MLLFADDCLLLASGPSEIVDIGTVILVRSALGVPYKWNKFRGGLVVQWIGYEIDWEKGLLGISEKRAAWLVDWLTSKVTEEVVDLADLSAVVGRLGFATGPLEFVRPFLAPVYAWVAAMGHRGRARLPWSLAFLFKFLADKWSGDQRLCS